jgi:catechol 2,3-dioxygenase-like lactoylglutathione lyase family enzyme
MKNLALLFTFATAACGTSANTDAAGNHGSIGSSSMELGTFSVSLAVKDLATSRAFYEKLGFRAMAGEPSQNWLIMRNGEATIGLFQGMFERNIMTFNPGWGRNCETLAQFTDVREIQKRLKAAGLKLTTEADEAAAGPASAMIVDPDGNPILFDQHVPR